VALWNRPDRKLILASRSPRRKELLKRMGLSFSVVAPGVQEERTSISGAAPDAPLRKLALDKAHSVAAQHPDALVLGADTVVVVGGDVLGKPDGPESARQMLRALSGRTHTVWSGVALVCASCAFEAAEAVATSVTFRRIGDEELEEYLSRAPYRDKAGAYGIQDAAMVFVEKIDGCYYNVVGLPVTATVRLLSAYERRKDEADV
jgi:septum formation protein